VELLVEEEEHDGPVRLVERVPFDLVDSVVQGPIALGELVPAVSGVLVVVRWFSKVVVVLSEMVYSALEVLVPVGDLLMAQNVMVEEEQHD
jgi:hypothetical protein